MKETKQGGAKGTKKYPKPLYTYMKAANDRWLRLRVTQLKKAAPRGTRITIADVLNGLVDKERKSK